MSQNIKLYIAHDENSGKMPDNKYLFPLRIPDQTGKTLKKALNDGFGVISHSCYGLAGQYWVWENVSAEYYGFMNSRRYFDFSCSDNMSIERQKTYLSPNSTLEIESEETFNWVALDERNIENTIPSYDFVAPLPFATIDGLTVYDKYRTSGGHNIMDLDTVLAVIRYKYPNIWPSAEKYMDQTKSYIGNMFVMKNRFFKEYSQFLFDILSAHEMLCETQYYSLIARPTCEYLSECICGIYLTYLFDIGQNGIELPTINYSGAVETKSKKYLNANVNTSSVEFGLVTRGEGKIYAEIIVDDKVKENDWTVHSRTGTGLSLPAKVVYANGKNVLVLPLLCVDQFVILEMKNTKGVTTNSVARKFAPLFTQFISKKNTFFGSSDIDAIRNCDRLFLTKDVQVIVEKIIPDVANIDIIQGSIRIPLEKQSTDNTYFTLVVLDADGRFVSYGDWDCLGDETHPMDDYSDNYIRVINYSICIPRVSTFTVWVAFPDNDYQSGFACVEEKVASDMRKSWRRSVVPACESKDYNRWFLDRHRSSEGELQIQRVHRFASNPIFSIIVPLYRTPLSFFNDMIDSVLNQTYENWELILVNASPDCEDLCSAVEEYKAKDQRIRCIMLEKNLGITENTNAGIMAATGDYLCFLDHDDFLELSTLYWYAREIDYCSDVDLLYCDEDKFLKDCYVNPFFKPDWNPDLLLGMNYVCHFLAVRKSIVDGMELPSSEYDGSQDYHMTFRVAEQARSIRHIPKVLYHWRVHDMSTAKCSDQKDYTFQASLLAIQGHLDRCGINGTVKESRLSSRRFVIDYDLESHPLVSIIIPNKDSLKVLHRCLMSIYKCSTYDNYEIIIVENNSSDQNLFEYYRAIQAIDSRIRVVALEGMETFNFSRIINFGVDESRGEYILMLNNDIEIITSDWIEQLLGPCMRHDVGIVGAKLYFPDDTIQHAGVSYSQDGPSHIGYQLPKSSSGNFENLLLARDVSAVTGACLLVKREVFFEVEGLDESFAVNYNDVDFCLRVYESGYRIVFCPTAELYHYESVSRGSETKGAKAIRFRKERGAFMERWPKLYELGDPYGNPNLEQGVYERLALDHG